VETIVSQIATEGVQVQDRLGVERWINEGGHIATEAVIQREMTAGNDALGEPAGQQGQTARPAEASSSRTPAAVLIARPPEDPARSRVLIAGGGVAGLETLLALRALAPDRVDITILAPELRFVNHSMAVDQSFKPKRSRGLRLEDTAGALGACWHQGALDRVEPEQHLVVTKDGDELPYDRLVLALVAAVPVGDPPGVVLALGAADPLDLLGHQLVHHAEPDTHAQREQPLLGRPEEIPEHGLRPLAQHRRLSLHFLAHDLSSVYFLHGGSSCLEWTDFALATVAARPDEAGGPPLQVLRHAGHPRD
jgi:hypothetical protein